MKSYKKKPGIYCNTDWKKINARRYILDDPTLFHLGDGVNLALLLCNDKSYSLHAYENLNELLNSFVIKNTVIPSHGKIEHLIIKPIGNLSDIYYFYIGRPILLIDLMDVEIANKIPTYLMKIVQHQDQEIGLIDFKCINKYRYQSLNPIVKASYAVVNLELASGSFRVKDGCYRAIWNAAVSFALKNECKLIIVGVEKIKYSWMTKTQKLNFMDLRGKLSINELVKIIGSNSCVAIFTFDNLIMHIGNIFEKKCFIKFRGKSSLIIEEFHYKFVNNSYREKDNIIYL